MNRANSWSRINITWPMFRAIYRETEPPESFLRIMSGMGHRLADTDEDAMISHFQLYRPTTGLASPGRDAADVVKYAEPLNRDAASSGRALLPLGWHLDFIQAVLSDWRAYLNYIDDGLRDLHEAVVMPRPLDEFPVRFAQVQKITLSRSKLYKAEMILHKTICLLREFASQTSVMAAMDCEHHSGPTAMQRPDPSRRIQNMLAEQQDHLHTTHRLLNMAGDLLLLYGKIMTNQGRKVIHTNSSKMTSIAQEGAAESKTMLTLAEQSGRESRTTRILTWAAMFYLPANLSFFSTQLVEQGDQGGIYVRPEVWWAVAFTLVLSLVTFAVTTWGLGGMNGRRIRMGLVNSGET
ncbi:hypothetical protein PspLS_11279 [Pyricularia sp. CBS 133598]|nr:hypothetical protein PspLS_11279 [Pyricularia sp. CBS 133598]